jgi:hypothetical protein
MIVGTEPKYMEICVREEGVDVAKLLDDTATVGSCTALKDGMELFVVDKDPNNTISELQDTSKIEKYTMSAETYAKVVRYFSH